MHLKKLPWTTAFLAVFTLTIAGLRLEQHLELTAAMHEPWRLWTGHFTHWNTDHLFWDLVVFMGLGAYCERRDRRAFLALIVLGVFAMSPPLLMMVGTYRGLSGLDTGLFALAACFLAETAYRERNGRMLACLGVAVAAFLGKSLFEAATGSTLFVDSRSAEFQPMVSAHLLGACAGVGCFISSRVTGVDRQTGKVSV